MSVIIPAYRAEHRICVALESLRQQDFEGPVEVIVVASGADGSGSLVRRLYPEVQVAEFPTRVWPGSARNVGVRMARGDVIAFMSADTCASRSWLADRVQLHAAGFDLVGGSILNGTPTHLVGTAGYLLEYSGLLPLDDLLRDQVIPHALSFRRAVFERLGEYSEDTRTGEDTLFNKRCLESGMTIAFAPQAGLTHDNITSVKGMIGHAIDHGRGLAQCVERHGFASSIGTMDQGLITAGWRMLVGYPVLGMSARLRRFARFAPRQLPALLTLMPLIWIALLATGVGAYIHYLKVRQRHSPA
ncbi:MAG: glycosyltransferase [Solirubrobacterales bacterium]